MVNYSYGNRTVATVAKIKPTVLVTDSSLLGTRMPTTWTERPWDWTTAMVTEKLQQNSSWTNAHQSQLGKVTMVT